MTITVNRSFKTYPITRFTGLVCESDGLLADLAVVNALDPEIPINSMTTFKNKTFHDELAEDLAIIATVAAAITDVTSVINDYEASIDYGPPILRKNVTYSYQTDQIFGTTENNTYKIGKILKGLDTAIVITIRRESNITVNRDYDPPSWNHAFSDGMYSGYIPSEDDSYIDSVLSDYEAVPTFRVAGTESLCWDQRELGFVNAQDLTIIATKKTEQKIIFIGKLNP